VQAPAGMHRPAIPTFKCARGCAHLSTLYYSLSSSTAKHLACAVAPLQTNIHVLSACKQVDTPLRHRFFSHYQEWAGCCEYEAKPGVEWTTFSPPSTHYPCQFISCNAMKIHGGLDGRQSCIAGPGRLMYARKYSVG
jgi:hypothetical protein